MTPAQMNRRNVAIRSDRSKMSVAALSEKYNLTQARIRDILNETPEILRKETERRKLNRAIERVRAAGYELQQVS